MTAPRDRVVDLVRAVAIVMVVLGHWLKQGLYVDDAGVLHRAGLLGRAEWTHPVTWVFQVMPLIFLVGGYVNALSWRHSSARGIGYGGWLRSRVNRLLAPLLPLLAFWAVAGIGAGSVGLGRDWLHVGSDTALLATWFLAVYAPVVALVPLTLRAWERWRWQSFLTCVAAAGVVDALTIATGDRLLVGAVNVLLVWGALHQLGYAWLDRAAPRRSVLILVAACALAVNVLLVWPGPYGVSLVGVSGHGLNNTYPTRVTVLLLGVAQAAILALLAPACARLASHPAVWRAVVVVDRHAMTIYLWHLTVLAVLAGVCRHLDGLGLRVDPASGSWWLLRPAWLTALAISTAVVVLLLGRVERHAAAPAPGPGPLVPLLEVLVLTGCLAALAADGLVVGDDNRWWVPATGVVVLVALRRWDELRSLAPAKRPLPRGPSALPSRRRPT
ncbi:MAG TPA: acyltransferase [Nocardioides sp.]|uniref:acyltransferase family protein n=1 Tax=Nocardioides sp. TaxID=35761 RepID=UPI002C8E05DA|nr:acyltransferase [Nocardioides sp.]HTW13882.1 acyltransferase [Nocardioides sp.]